MRAATLAMSSIATDVSVCLECLQDDGQTLPDAFSQAGRSFMHDGVTACGINRACAYGSPGVSTTPQLVSKDAQAVQKRVRTEVPGWLPGGTGDDQSDKAE